MFGRGKCCPFFGRIFFGKRPLFFDRVLLFLAPVFWINFRERTFAVTRGLSVFARSLASIVSVLVFSGVCLGVVFLCLVLSLPPSRSAFFPLLGAGPGFLPVLLFPPTKVHGLRHLPPGAIHVHSLFSFSPLPLAWVGSGSCSCSFCFSFSLFLSLCSCIR